jgi:hypothetical protein
VSFRSRPSRRRPFSLPRAAGALAGAALLALAGAAAPAVADDSAPPPRAQGATASPAAPAEPATGLYGEGDPQFDGVYRQSVALLAQDAAGYTPAGTAVGWLLDQQCQDGSFLAYRENPARPCGDVTAADTNATGMAVQALAALGGHEEAVSSALAWLRGVQNGDGGWSFNPGGATDANSTAVVVGAFAAAGEDPAEVRRGDNSPFDALAALQLGCEAATDERGAFAWQPDPGGGALSPNEAATVDAVLASYGSGLLADPEAPAGEATPLACDGTGGGATGGAGQSPPDPAASASAGAAYLAGVLAENGGPLLAPPPPGGDGERPAAEQDAQPDYGTTARAVIALAAGGLDEERQPPLDWLLEHHAEWPGYAASPAAVGMLVLAAHAGGVDPADFGDTDLVEQLNAFGPAPSDTATEAGAEDQAEGSGDGGSVAWPWLVGAAVVAGVGIGMLLSLRRARRRAAGDA